MGSSASAGDLRVPWEFVAAGPAHGTIQVAFDAAATEAFTNPMGETNRGESMFEIAL
jgi:hypothetical protein